MAALGNILANSFQLPVQQAQAQTEQAAPVGMGSPEEGLQHIEGITNDYYGKWSEVQNFAQEMNDIGIDVTHPDRRSREASDAGNLYRKMIADLQYKGNELKNSQKMLEKFAQARLSSYGADIGYNGDPNKPFDIYQAEHKGIGSVQKDANIQDRLSQQIDATSDENTKRINANALQGDLNRATQLAIAKLRTNTAKAKTEETIAPYKTLYEDGVNLITGNTNWTQSTTRSATGKQMLQSKFWEGKRYGSYEDVSPRGAVTTKPRIITGGLLDVDTGEVFIQFEHGAMEKVDSDALAGMVATYAESNKGYKGADAQVFTGMLEEQDFAAPKVSEDQSNRSQAVYEQEQKDKDAIAGQIRGWFGGTKEFPLDDGTVIEIDREGRGGLDSGNRIKDAEALGLPDSASGDRIYTDDETIDMLHMLGYYNSAQFRPEDNADGTPAAAPAAAPKPVQEGLINRDYKSPDYIRRRKAQREDFDRDFALMDKEIERVATKNTDDVDLVAAAMNVFLELDAEAMFEDWYNSGGREVGIEELGGEVAPTGIVPLDTTSTNNGFDASKL